MRLLPRKEISRCGRRWSPRPRHRLFWLPTGTLVTESVITTLHGRLDLPALQDVYAEFPEVPLVSISEAQRRPLPQASWLSTIYNGIDLRHFTLRERRGSYLAFLGRISPEKCPDRAIAI